MPDAMANLAAVPDGLTGHAGADVLTSCRPASPARRPPISGSVTPWRSAQGPIAPSHGGGEAQGCTTIIAVDLAPERLAMAKRLGADAVVNFKEVDAGRRSWN
ncbi:MAG: hypothetical protein R3C69_01880 [Geminicoccaceae bacterium]